MTRRVIFPHEVPKFSQLNLVLRLYSAINVLLIPWQLITLPNLRIIDYGLGFTGSTHDSTAFQHILIELDVILAQKTRAVDQNPADTESKSQIEVLQQVR